MTVLMGTGGIVALNQITKIHLKNIILYLLFENVLPLLFNAIIIFNIIKVF
jgi:hypothetical protein